jgi:hypothetical protein
MYYNIDTFFKQKATLDQLQFVVPIHQKLKLNNRRKIGLINGLALHVLGSSNIIYKYPRYTGELAKKKKTFLKRKVSLRNMFCKTYVAPTFLNIFLQCLAYSKIFLKQLDILFKQKSSFDAIKKDIFYRKKLCNRKKRCLRTYSFKFPTNINDFAALSRFHSIFHVLSNLQIHVNIKAYTKQEAILYTKQHLLFV